MRMSWLPEIFHIPVLFPPATWSQVMRSLFELSHQVPVVTLNDYLEVLSPMTCNGSYQSRKTLCLQLTSSWRLSLGQSWCYLVVKPSDYSLGWSWCIQDSSDTTGAGERVQPTAPSHSQCLSSTTFSFLHLGLGQGLQKGQAWWVECGKTRSRRERKWWRNVFMQVTKLDCKLNCQRKKKQKQSHCEGSDKVLCMIAFCL